jgi:hypothetical protein
MIPTISPPRWPKLSTLASVMPIEMLKSKIMSIKIINVNLYIGLDSPNLDHSMHKYAI